MARKYTVLPERGQDSGAWRPSARQPSKNQFRKVRKIRYGDLDDIRFLDNGAMCSCYTAQLEGFQTVVIKKPNARSRERDTEIERELDIEKEYLASLRHPHIVTLIGGGRRGLDGNLEPFIVLEYLKGGTLGNLISERRNAGGATMVTGVNRKRGAFELPHFVLPGNKNYIPWAQAMGWARDMASALRYMHDEASEEHVYICRDLKPDNIGFAADGTLKLFDFGLAKRVVRKSRLNQRYTMTSGTGTVRYMAPEAFLDTRYNEKVDVYAWSHVVAEMLSLEVPYNNMDARQFKETVALGMQRPVVERRWPGSIKKLLRRCWSRNPENRPSFAEMLNAGTLEQAAGPHHHTWLQRFGFHNPTAAPLEAELIATTATAIAEDLTPESLPSSSVSTPAAATNVQAGDPATTDVPHILEGNHDRNGDTIGAECAGKDHADRASLRWNASRHDRSCSGTTPTKMRIGPFLLPFCLPRAGHRRGAKHRSSCAGKPKSCGFRDTDQGLLGSGERERAHRDSSGDAPRGDTQNGGDIGGVGMGCVDIGERSGMELVSDLSVARGPFEKIMAPSSAPSLKGEGNAWFW